MDDAHSAKFSPFARAAGPQIRRRSRLRPAKLGQKGDDMARSAYRPRILVVEDHPMVRGLVQEILEADGYVVTAVADVDAAVGQLERERFALVVTDGYRRSGAPYAGAEAVRLASPSPVILFTAHRISRDAAIEAGFSELIAKPFELATFEQTIQQVLGRQAAL